MRQGVPIERWSAWQRWWYAAKPASWPKLIVPSLLGQALGEAAAGAFSWRAALFGAVFTCFDLLAIVFLNDWGDQRVDAIKRRRFPHGCSPKTIPDQVLSSRALLIAGLASVAGLVAWSWVGQVWLGRPHLGTMGLLAALTFQIYTFGPLRLNYRGGGELLEMLGVGVVLPGIHAYAQSGALLSPVYLFLVGFALLSLASALASGLSDEESDREGGKTTFVTAFGNAAVRRGLWGCMVAGMVAWLVVPWVTRPLLFAAAIPAVAVVFYYTRRMQRVSPQAHTNAFAAQGRLKAELHHAIWRGALVLAACVAVLP